MNDDQKWLEAAAGIEQDIFYLKAALQSAQSCVAISLAKDIERLQVALAVYQKNASTGVPWPSPDDLFCINLFSSPQQVSTAMRRDFKFAC